MTKLVATALALSLLGVAGAQTPRQVEDPHLQRGLALFRQQNFADALQEFQAAEKAHPGTYEIENLLGITATQLGHNDEADRYYRKAIALNPKAPGPHKNLGFSELNQKDYAAAKKELDTALALDPTDRFTHFYLASLYLATAQDAKAVDQLEPASDLLRNEPRTEFSMIKACLKTGHTQQASGLIQDMVIRSQLTDAQNYELAVLMSSLHLYLQAVERFQYALAAQPQSWVVQYNLAIAWLNAGKPERAIPLFNAVAQAQPANAAVLTSLGSAYEAADELPQALDAYKQAVAADPQNPDCYLDYTRLLMELDRYDEATRVVEQGIQGIHVPEEEYALDIRLGVLKLKQGQYEQACAAFNKAIKLHPEIVLGYVALAQTYMQQGKDEDALQPLLQARASLPQDATLEYYTGLLLMRVGRKAEGETALKNSIRLREQEPEPHYELGKYYAEQNQLEPARREFERVIALDPNNGKARYQLSRIYSRLGEKDKAAQMADAAKRLLQTQQDAALATQKAHSNQFQAPAASN